MITAYQVGLAAGTALAGALVQTTGETTAAFLAAFAFVALAAAITFAGRRTLTPQGP